MDRNDIVPVRFFIFTVILYENCGIACLLPISVTVSLCLVYLTNANSHESLETGFVAI